MTEFKLTKRVFIILLIITVIDGLAMCHFTNIQAELFIIFFVLSIGLCGVAIHLLAQCIENKIGDL